MWGIVGLGNPGGGYDQTRHNIGFEVIHALASAHGIRIGRPRAAAVAGTGRIDGERVVLAMPLTMMNASGVAVVRLCHLYEIEPEDLIVIVDDLNLELGQLRLRRGGSAGGHNGLRSINEKLGTKDYPRLRIGIGGPPGGMDARDWVLSEFAPEEREAVEEVISRASACVETAVTEGIEAAMNAFNR
ncbi:MAG: aminoacyl-tRNA hydrolase [Armatimonadota bacterium]|jgi:PTH1 family peptidyl-tRNA hydrolase